MPTTLLWALFCSLEILMNGCSWALGRGQLVFKLHITCTRSIARVKISLRSATTQYNDMDNKVPSLVHIAAPLHGITRYWLQLTLTFCSNRCPNTLPFFSAAPRWSSKRGMHCSTAPCHSTSISPRMSPVMFGHAAESPHGSW